MTPKIFSGRFILPILLSILFLSTLPLFSQGYDDTFDIRNKIKVEVQYADYGEYEYPEPVIFTYGVQDYNQDYPYLVNFPERRGLFKFTRLIGSQTAISAKYQYSDIRVDVKQHLGELKFTRNFGKSFIGLIGMQMSRDTRGYNAYMPGMGFRWELGPLTIVQGDAQYYYRGDDAEAVGGELGSLNLRLKVRQVLTLSTAFFVEYLYYNARGDAIDFISHTGSFWLSQFISLTQSALHLNVRLYDNSLGIQAISPSLELAQYINWATILRLKYRYYANESDDISLGEQGVIIPDNLVSHTVSLQINREINPDVQIYGKYRYYQSSLGIQMNTYLMGFIYSF